MTKRMEPSKGSRVYNSTNKNKGTVFLFPLWRPRVSWLGRWLSLWNAMVEHGGSDPQHLIKRKKKRKKRGGSACRRYSHIMNSLSPLLIQILHSLKAKRENEIEVPNVCHPEHVSISLDFTFLLRKSYREHAGVIKCVSVSVYIRKMKRGKAEKLECMHPYNNQWFLSTCSVPHIHDFYLWTRNYRRLSKKSGKVNSEVIPTRKNFSCEKFWYKFQIIS